MLDFITSELQWYEKNILICANTTTYVMSKFPLKKLFVVIPRPWNPGSSNKCS